MLAINLESKNVHPPRGHGWASYLSRLLDNTCADDEVVVGYAQKIKEAAIERRLNRRIGA